MLALQQVRDAAGKFHHLDAAGQFAACIRQHLAVLAGDGHRDVIGIGLEQLFELEQDAGAVQRRGGRPPGKGRLRRGDGGFHFLL